MKEEKKGQNTDWKETLINKSLHTFIAILLSRASLNCKSTLSFKTTSATDRSVEPFQLRLMAVFLARLLRACIAAIYPTRWCSLLQMSYLQSIQITTLQLELFSTEEEALPVSQLSLQKFCDGERKRQR